MGSFIPNSWLYAVPPAGGKVILVTGANSGLGYESSLAFAKAGATVVMLCRNETRGNEALASIKKKVPDANVDMWICDVSSLASVREFSERFSKAVDRVDVLCNNAGVMAIKDLELTPDGVERQMATNHLGHFALTGLLFANNVLAEDVRIVNVSSMLHTSVTSVSGLNDNFSYQGRYDPWRVYGETKLANVLFTRELNKRFRAKGKGAVAVAAHPGYSATNLQTDRMPLYWLLNGLFAQSQARGALPQIRACLDADVRADDYWGPRWTAFGSPVRAATSAAAKDDAAAQRLWEVSAELTSVGFDGL